MRNDAHDNRTQDVAAAMHIAADDFALPSALLASVPHDLRNPLSVILGASEMLHEGFGSLAEEDRHSYLGAIRRECLRMDEYVQGLFHVTRLFVGGPARLVRETIDVGDVIDAALERLARYRDVRVAVDLGSPLRSIQGHAVLLTQALLNVLDNAAKFSPQHGVVKLRAMQDAAGNTDIEVDDAGPGIQPEQRERVFGSFVSGDPQSRGRAGSGLGLAISRSILRAHGGDVIAEEPAAGASGARVRLTIPAPASAKARRGE